MKEVIKTFIQHFYTYYLFELNFKSKKKQIIDKR